MKIFVIFTIIINSSYFIRCSKYENDNINHNINYNSSLNLSRNKRAYTRWRKDHVTTSEFIVKVLDDESSTQGSRSVVAAVNIQPSTQKVVRKIIGGAITKFVPALIPGTEVENDNNQYIRQTPTSVTLFKGNCPSSVPTIIIEKLNSQAPNLNRPNLNSLPVEPQFLPNSLSVINQFAPIESVAFNRRDEESFVLPVSDNKYVPQNTQIHPMRTSVFVTRSTIPEYPRVTDMQFPVRSTIPEYSRVTDMQFPIRSTIPEYSRVTDMQFPIRSTIPEYSRVTNRQFSIPDYSRVQINNMNYPNRNRIPEYIDIKSKNLFNNDDLSNNLIPQRTELEYYSTRTMTMPDEFIPTQTPFIDTNILEQNKLLNNKEDFNSYNLWFYNDNEESSTSKKEDIDGENVEIDIRDDDYKDFSNLTNILDIFETEENDDSGIRNNINTKDNNESNVHTLSQSSQFTDKFLEKNYSSCILGRTRPLAFSSPRTLQEILIQLKQWADESPVAKWVDITNGNLTTMENSIYMMIIDDPSSGQIVSAKQTVMILAGIQGRDHHAVTAALYVLYELIERSEVHADLLTKYRFWIIPVFNPDGYDYSMTFPNRREWLKNVRQNWDVCKNRKTCQSCETLGLGCTLRGCYGVHLDRNFEYQWISSEELRTEHPCGALYAGERQLSERETIALTQYLEQHQTKMYAFIAFKEGDILRRRASLAASAAYSINGRPYVAGQTSEFLPLYAGGVEDWMDGHLGIDNTYTIMMYRPSDTYDTKMPTEHIVHEAYAAMDTLLLQSVQNQPQPSPMFAMKSAASATQIKPFLMFDHVVIYTLIIMLLNYL